MNSIVYLMKQVPFFQGLEEDSLYKLAPLFVERKYKKGSILFLEGDPGEELFLIWSGAVKIYRIFNDKEIVLAIFRDGDYFGEMSLIQKDFSRSANAETLETSRIYSLRMSDFSNFVETHPRISFRLLENTMDRLRRANEQIYDLTFYDVRSRIIRTLVRLTEEHGVSRDQGIIINMKLTHQQIANMVGTVRESVTKVLQELQEEHLITVDKKMICVKDRDALTKKYVI